MEKRQKHTNAPPRDDDSKDINEYEGKHDKDPDPKATTSGGGGIKRQCVS